MVVHVFGNMIDPGAHLGAWACRLGLLTQLRSEGAAPLVIGGHDASVIERHRPETLVVNAEGACHHGRGAHLFEAIVAGRRVGARVVCANAVLQELTESQHDAARAADLWIVRDRASLIYASSNGIPARLGRDTIFSFRGWIPLALHPLPGRVTGDCHHEGRVQLDDCDGPAFTLEADRHWRRAVATLRGAGCYVTGRWHGAMLAMLADVPVVLVDGANSHKLEALAAEAGVPLIRRLEDVESASPEKISFRDPRSETILGDA